MRRYDLRHVCDRPRWRKGTPADAAMFANRCKAGGCMSVLRAAVVALLVAGWSCAPKDVSFQRDSSVPPSRGIATQDRELIDGSVAEPSGQPCRPTVVVDRVEAKTSLPGPTANYTEALRGGVITALLNETSVQAGAAGMRDSADVRLLITIVEFREESATHKTQNADPIQSSIRQRDTEQSRLIVQADTNSQDAVAVFEVVLKTESSLLKEEQGFLGRSTKRRERRRMTDMDVLNALGVEVVRKLQEQGLLASQ